MPAELQWSMMLLISVLAFALTNQIAQNPTPSPAPAPPAAPILDTRGPCLESPKQVPNVMDVPLDRSSEIVRIDKVISTATYTPNEIIGFLYTRSDGKTFLGQRSAQYTSPASAAAINAVLASTHAPDVKESAFPPQTRLGVRTGNAEFFRVNIPPAAMEALQIRTEACVAWPQGRPLPDPAP